MSKQVTVTLSLDDARTVLGILDHSLATAKMRLETEDGPWDDEYTRPDGSKGHSTVDDTQRIRDRIEAAWPE